MKHSLGLIATLALLGLFAACTMQTGTVAPKSAKGRVLIAAVRPQTGAVKPAATRLSKAAGARSLGAGMASSRYAMVRDLSASTDIASMTYSVIDTGGKGEATLTGPISASYPYIDLYLTPGESYRIVVDVALTPKAPGTNVGVSRYGDQADFTVDPYYDTYVDLTIHPTQSYVFDPASVISAATSTIQAYNPTATKNFFTGAVTKNPADKLFYGPDAKLYYFNKTANSVYQWTNVNSPMGSGDVVLTGAASTAKSLGGTAVTIYAACADAQTASMLWVVGYDTSDSSWYYYSVDFSGTNVQITKSPSITTDLENGDTPTVIVPTGIAVDNYSSTNSDIYITYYNTGGTSVHSGLLEYFNNAFYFTYPANVTTPPSISENVVTSGGAASIFTDVAWEQNKLWVLSSPNTGLSGITANQGTADILYFDWFLSQQTPTVTLTKSYPTAGSMTLSGATKLILPNRFTGPPQGSTLYLSQTDFKSGGTEKISAINLDTGVVTTF